MITTDIDWQEYARFAEVLAVAAAADILPYFRTRPEMDNKLASGFDPVTAADQAGERAMRALIEATFPDHGIVGEEYGDRPSRSPFTWVLDPVDGTRSFVCGMTSWATLVGLTYEGRPMVGVMHQPYVGEVFVGSPNGSFLKHAGRCTKLATSPTASLTEAIATTTAPHLYRSERQGRFLAAVNSAVRFMRYDGDSYFFCMLAAGQIDLALDAGLQPYDIAALIPIIEGAGGVVATWDGGTAAGGGDILAAANRDLFDQASALLTEG
jgi:histidinol phosphatase-like enzyme (inositol monophosphatase family)